MMKTLGIALAIGLVACGGGNASSPSGEKATGNTLTSFQRSRLLGHYSTQDGASGFILDRTQTPFRAKLDGTNQVKVLSESHGPFETHEYRSDDHSIWIRIDENGEVQLFQGPKQHEGVEVLRDADADQLK